MHRLPEIFVPLISMKRCEHARTLFHLCGASRACRVKTSFLLERCRRRVKTLRFLELAASPIPVLFVALFLSPYDYSL